MGLFDFLKKRSEPPANGPDLEVERLVVLLGAADTRTRLDAARSLGALGVRAATAQEALEVATSDDDNDVCTAAADALSAIRRALDGRA